MKKERKTGVFEIIAVFWLILAYCINIVYAALNAETLLDSDMASEMILSNILNQERSVTGLTEQWIYSTELRVFETQWIYRIGLFFSPHNWHFARVISIALFLILLSFCVIILFKAADLTNYSAFAAALCLMPMGGWYFWQTLFGSYYMPYIYISLLTVALMLLISKESSTRRKAVYFVLISFLGIASGLNGVKQLMVFGAPFVISTFLLCLYEIRQDKNPDNKKELMQTFSDLGIAVSHCAFSLAGYIINSKVLADKYYFKQFNDTEIWGKSIWEYVRYYIWSFGYAEGKKIVSLRGIASMLGVLMGMFVIASAIRLLSRFGKLSFNEKRMVLFCAVSIAFNIFIFSYVNGAIQYFQPVVPLGLLLIILELKTEDYTLPIGRISAFVCIMMLSLVISAGTLKNEFDSPLHIKRAKPEMGKIVEIALEHGYDKGVATFWHSNIITELSDGRIDMWTLESNSSDKMYEWLQKREHIGAFPSDRYFFAADASSDYDSFVSRHSELEIIYSDDKVVLYGN